MNNQSVYQLAPGLELETVDDEAILLNVEEDVFFGLNPVGFTIVTFVQNGHSVAEIIASVVEEFEVTSDEATEDVHDFLSALIDAELLVSVT